MWSRLLDGERQWGSFDAMVGRYGLRRYRMVVFPPGIRAIDRRLLRLWRGWPVGGGLLAILAAMLLGEAVPSDLVFVATTYVGVGAVLFVVTAGVRTGVRSISLILLVSELDPCDRRRYAEWETLVDLLTRADSMLKAGAIDSTQHEALWWHAYCSLEEHARV